MNATLPGAEWIDPAIATEHLALVDAVSQNDLETARTIIREHAEHGIDTMVKALEK